MLIQEYQQSWQKDFNEIKNIIDDALQPLPVLFEHIGSTAIPGLAAKPIIDIDIVFETPVTINAIKKKLEKIGYAYYGNQGIAGREVFKRSNHALPHKVLDTVTHHLYVCPKHSEELQRHLLFRNYLIANKEIRIQYQNLKYKLAADAYEDRKKYAALKEVEMKLFFKNIIELAKNTGTPKQ